MSKESAFWSEQLAEVDVPKNPMNLLSLTERKTILLPENVFSLKPIKKNKKAK